jgi:ribosomal protein S18 acetylase RimI-like enzyme
VDESPSLIHLQLADLAAAIRHTAGPLPPGMHLRTVDLPADFSLIAELYNAAFGLSGTGAVTPEQVAGLVHHPALSASAAFLVFAGEQAVGLGVASVELSPPGGTGRRGAVELLAVRPGYRRRGIGRALLHAVLSRLHDLGVRLAVASVEDAGPLAMLTRYGFRPLNPPA